MPETSGPTERIAAESIEGARIVVVDDDAELRLMVAQLLTKQGCKVTAVADGAGLQSAIAAGKVDLVVLDLNLEGGESGLDLMRQLRAPGDVPILILTAMGDPVDRIVGFELGADDYLVKPFHARELLGRVRSILRRTWRAPPAPDLDTLRFGPWRIDLRNHLLIGERVSIGLSPGELVLIRQFAASPGKVMSRAELAGVARDEAGSADDRHIDLQVARLRRKLELAEGDGGSLIRTVRGRGYLYAP